LGGDGVELLNVDTLDENAEPLRTPEQGTSSSTKRRASGGGQGSAKRRALSGGGNFEEFKAFLDTAQIDPIGMHFLFKKIII